MDDIKILRKNEIQRACFCVEFWILFKRHLCAFSRVKENVYVGFVGSLVATLICLSLYGSNGVKATDIPNRCSALFVAAITNLNISYISSILVFNVKRDLMYKEAQKNYYRLSTFYFSNLCVEVPFWILVCLILSPLVYWGCHFNTARLNMFRYFITVPITVLAGQSLGCIVGCVASDMESAAVL